MPSPLPRTALLVALLVLTPFAAAVGPTPAGAIRLVRDTDGVALEPGARATFVLEVRNEYPFEETVDVHLFASDVTEWSAEASPRSFAIPAGRSATVTIVVEREANATGGNATLSVRAEGAPFPGNDTASFNLTALPRLPEPVAPPEISLHAQATQSPIRADPGADVVVPFAIANAGEAPLAVAAVARGPAGWAIEPRPAAFDVAEGGHATVTVSVRVPGEATGRHRVTLDLRGLAPDGRHANATAFADVMIEIPNPSTADDKDGAARDSAAPPREETARRADPPAAAPPRDPHTSRDPPLEIEVAIVRVPAGGAGATRVVARNPGSAPVEVPLTVEPPPGWTARLEPTALAIPAGGTASAWLHVAPEVDDAALGDAVVRSDRAAARVALAISPPADLEDADASHLATQARPFTAAPPSPAPPLLAILAVALLGAAVHRVLGDPDRRWKLAGALAALYTRTPPARLLDNPTRARLFSLVAAEPGLHFNEIKRRAGLRTGALIHHLARLERHGIVTSRRDGNKRRFYAIGDAPAKAVSGGRGTRDDILRALDAAGGAMRRPDLASALACSRQLLHYHLRALREDNVVLVTPDGTVRRRPPGDG